MNTISKNIVLIGMPGCGKTIIGKKLAKALDLEFCDIDSYIEEKFKITIPEIFKKGEAYFREIETRYIKEISKSYPKVVSTGGGVVKKTQNMEMLKSNAITIYINRPPEEIIKDINIENRPLLSGGRGKLYDMYEERHKLYKYYSDIEIKNDESEDNAVSKIISFL